MKKLFYLALVAIVFTSCLNGSETFLSIQSGQTQLPSYGKDTLYYYISSTSAFTVSSPEQWCRTDISKGEAGYGRSLVCYLDSNPDLEPRNVKVYVSNSTQSTYIEINQPGSPAPEEDN